MLDVASMTPEAGHLPGRHRVRAGVITGATVVLARHAIVDVPTLTIALLSVVYLLRLRFRLKEPLLVAPAGIVGLTLPGL